MRQCNNLYIRTPEDGHVNVRNMWRPFMRKNHSKIVCIKLVHLPYLFCVCVCSVSYPSCNVHALYHTVNCVLSTSTSYSALSLFAHMIFQKNVLEHKMCNQITELSGCISSETNTFSYVNFSCIPHLSHTPST